jgi:hypothetical protein
MGKMINVFHTKRVLGYLKNHGGKVLTGVENPDLIDPSNLFIPMTVVENPDDNSALMTEEIFGPVIPIKTFDHIDEAIKYVRDRPKPLACYYFGPRFAENFYKIESQISCGGMVMNDVILQLASKDLPFGGVGGSGYGRYHGIYGFKSMSNQKSILNKMWSNFFPYNTFDYPFTPIRKKTIITFQTSSFFMMTQKQLIKRLFWIAVFIYILHGIVTGRFKAKYLKYKWLIDIIIVQL